MIELTTNTSNSLPSPIPQKSSNQETNANKLPVFSTVTTPEGIHISSEAQHLFDMEGYLQQLDKEEQAKAIGFLSRSDDPLHAMALKHFNDTAETRSFFTEEVIRSIKEQSEAAAATLFKITERDPALIPDIAVIPAGTDIYRLDGKINYYPYQAGTFDSKLKAQVDELEANSASNLKLQDSANIFGTVRNALQASENILQSFDDVLYFNYMLEKARASIKQTNAPDDIKSKLNNILDQSIKYQDAKQTKHLANIQTYTNNSFVGAEVRENINSTIAAQTYNKELQEKLKLTHLSVLNAGSIMTGLLSKHTDLIKFSPNKINDALSFYRQDFDTYQDFVTNGYRPPEDRQIIYDTTPLTEGHNYALKVIEEIQNYVSNSKSI